MSEQQGPGAIFPMTPTKACFSGSWHHVLKLLFSLRKPHTDIITAACFVSENRLTSLPFHSAQRLVFIHCRVNRVCMCGSEFMNEEEHVWKSQCLVSEGEGSDNPVLHSHSFKGYWMSEVTYTHTHTHTHTQQYIYLDGENRDKLKLKINKIC